MVASAGFAQEKLPDDWMPWKDPKNPGVQRLNLDGSENALIERRDTSGDAKRDPGPVNPQRYALGFLAKGGFPTYLGAPLAFTTADLKAGKVDVALVGLTIDDQVIPGAGLAANAMRALNDYTFYPDATDNVTGVDYLPAIAIADYGNVASHFGQNERSLEEVHKVVGEILAADTVPLGVGGTYIQSYGFITALAQKYGPKSFVLVHVDAHYDALTMGVGRFVHNGNLIYQAVERGLVKGEDIIQIGLRGPKPDGGDFKWMVERKLRFHFQAEIDHDGFDAVLRRLLAEVKGRRVYLTFDMDGIDPAWAAAVGTQEPGGLTGPNAMTLVRALAIQNHIVAAEFNEYNPLMDDRHHTTGILMDRLIRALLAGMVARKQGITDPFYVDPQRLHHRAAK
ncbi:MAG: arginase family protein [Methyloceanibacter sp.]